MSGDDNQPTASLFERCVTRREMLLTSGGALVGILLIGCGGEQREQAQGGGGQQQAQGGGQRVYFGWLLGTPEIGAVAFDVSAPNGEDARDVVAYVCNGVGGEEALAVWFKGVVSGALGETGETQSLTSAGGQEELLIAALNDHEVFGSFTNAFGQSVRYAATPATGGAGIYEVTLDEDLNYTGTSTDGSRLEARADEEGNVQGTVTTADGEKIEFVSRTLALASPQELAEQGLSENFANFEDRNLIPGEYVAVISPGADHWFGRSGNVRGGSPGANIIGLDKSH